MIDVSHWNYFDCKKLFTCKNTGNILARDIEDGSGDTPYVTASAFNNGVYAYIDASKYEIIKGHCILVGGKTFTITYQKNDFVSNDSHNFVIRVKDYDISQECYLYLVSLIKSYFGQKYSWNDAVTKDKILSETIPLPTNSKGEPDWKYMDSYMKKILIDSEKNISELSSSDTNNNPIELKNWKRFHLYDDCLFDIDMGTKLDKAKMSDIAPTINFVGRANANNGITTCVDLIDNLKPYPAGTLTVSLGGEYLGSCFVQPGDFYTSQNVIVLIPKWDMPFEVKQFIATMIFKESRTYYKAFIDELNRHIKTDFSFYLPVIEDGTPDWDYMKNYITKIFNEEQRKVNIIQEGI
jgi:hypothetical protein